MFGAETILMQRAASEEVFHKTVRLINDFKQYFMKHEQPIYENPSPGNKTSSLAARCMRIVSAPNISGTSVKTVLPPCAIK
jgi:altronate dehydratase